MENGSTSRSRSLERQRGSSFERQSGSSLERQRGSSLERQSGSSREKVRGSNHETQRGSNLESQRGSHVERQRGSSTERQRGSCSEKQNGCFLDKRGFGSYTSGLVVPPYNGNPASLYLPMNDEYDQSLSQGQESSRRYAAFLKQDGLLRSDINHFTETRNYNTEKSSSQTSLHLDSPNDHIAPERLVQQQKRRPSTTPATLFHLPSSKSHTGPGIACNFDVTLERVEMALGKPSTTSLDAEVAVFQNGLNDVTQQLELIQETQGTILTELANDIEALQSENSYLRESRDRLQCANDNLLKVVQDLTKEISLKKDPGLNLSSSSKNLKPAKTPKDMLKGIETILNASRTNINYNNESSLPKRQEYDKKETEVSRVNSTNTLKSKHSSAVKKPKSSKSGYSRGDVPRPKVHSKSHKSSGHREPSEKVKSTHHSKSENDAPNYNDEIANDSPPRRHQSRMDRRQEDDGSDSDDYPPDGRDGKKKKKNGCFNFGRKRHDRRRHHRHGD